MGPPHTGATIFHDLLALDPDNRAPWLETWPGLLTRRKAGYNSVMHKGDPGNEEQ